MSQPDLWGCLDLHLLNSRHKSNQPHVFRLERKYRQGRALSGPYPFQGLIHPPNQEVLLCISMPPSCHPYNVWYNSKCHWYPLIWMLHWWDDTNLPAGIAYYPGAANVLYRLFVIPLAGAAAAV